MFRVLLAFVVCSISCLSASAQGLIWSLPEDGRYVTYRGTYTQLDVQASTQNEDVTSEWRRELTIKSVGTATENFQGMQTACRWVEFSLINGHPQDAQLVPGPVGEVIYKVLIPESAVIGKVEDENGLYVSYLPIVRGYRKIGDAEPMELSTGVLQVYPMITLLMHYREMTSEGNENPDTNVAQSAEKFTASKVIENVSTRINNNATLWKSDEVPFGLVKWTVTQVRERKADTDPRSTFSKTSEVTVSMTAEEVGNNAQSDLPDNN